MKIIKLPLLIIILVLVLAALGGAGYYFKFQVKQPVVGIPSSGEIIIKGEIVCLPHKNTKGAQTMECAFGLKDEQGRYYGLHETDPEYKNISGAPMQIPVTISGVFIPKEDEKYQSIGVIDLEKIIY